jgi:hypothetical protein
VFLGVTRGGAQGCALARALTDLSKSPRDCEAWSLGELLRLAALPCGSEHKALTALVTLFAQRRAQHRARQEAEQNVRRWLGSANGELPLLGLAAGMLKPSARQHFVESLQGCCGVPRCDLRCACRLLLAAFRPAALSEAWSAAAITRWASLTLGRERDPWAHEESIERLKIVSDAGLPARRVLERLEARAVSAKEWDARLELLLARPAAPSVASSAPIPLAQREAEQYEAPAPGEARWYDAHEQPEHQALLLDHTLRELMSLLFHLSLSTEDQGVLTIEDGAVERVLRGDLEYISLENRRAPRGKMHISPEALAQQLAALAAVGTELRRSILFEGSASTDERTGRCLPRRYLWAH